MALRDRDKARNEDGTVSGEATPPKREEQVIELQFQRSNIAVCAHYGYVVSVKSAREWGGLSTDGSTL